MPLPDKNTPRSTARKMIDADPDYHIMEGGAIVYWPPEAADGDSGYGVGAVFRDGKPLSIDDFPDDAPSKPALRYEPVSTATLPPGAPLDGGTVLSDEVDLPGPVRPLWWVAVIYPDLPSFHVLLDAPPDADHNDIAAPAIRAANEHLDVPYFTEGKLIATKGDINNPVFEATIYGGLDD